MSNNKPKSVIINGYLWSHNDLVEFKRLYNLAAKEEVDTFRFRGQEVLVSYARYVLEYAESQLGRSI